MTLPQSVTTIGEGAFAYCSGLETIQVTINNTSYYAENNCLVEIASGKIILGCKNSVIPVDNVQSIGGQAFAGCTGLTTLAIPKNISSIGEMAFADCTGLTEMIIPSSVTTLGENVFVGCTNLKIYCAATTQPIGWANNWNASNCEVAWGYREASQGLAYSLALDGNSYIVSGKGSCEDTEIVIPATYQALPVTAVGANAFNGNQAITSVFLPASIVEIGANAFYDCKNLTTVEFAKDCALTTIGANAFCYAGLTGITLPETVNSVGDFAFDGLAESAYNVYGVAYYVGSASNPHMVLVKAVNIYITSCTIYENCKFIDTYAFNGCLGLSIINIPESVVYIGNAAFEGCINLTIYCAIKEQPITWAADWNYCMNHSNGTSYCSVMFDYTYVE